MGADLAKLVKYASNILEKIISYVDSALFSCLLTRFVTSQSSED